MFFGRSDRIRTCGIDVPNVARYQLRHTPKCEKYSIFRSISVSGQICGQTAFLFWFWKRECAKKSVFTRIFEPSENLRPKPACMLPKQARYQLRYIPLFLRFQTNKGIISYFFLFCNTYFNFFYFIIKDFSIKIIYRQKIYQDKRLELLSFYLGMK